MAADTAGSGDAPLIIASIARLGFDIGHVEVKRRERANAEDPAEPFIDREGYLRYIDRAEQRFREKLADQQRQ